MVLNYVPHGINSKIFYPINESDSSYLEFKKFEDDFRKQHNVQFLIFWNNRNIRRKQPGDVILAFKTFCDMLTQEQKVKCALLLHTDPIDENGTDLFSVQRMIGTNCKILFSDGRIDSKILNYYYNLADVTLNIASNEGFGLSSAESIMAGTPVINNVTGGLQDHLRFEDNDGECIKFDKQFTTNNRGTYRKCGPWAYPVFPSNISLQGSLMTPYIFDERCSYEDVAYGMLHWYNISKDKRKEFGLLGRNWMLSEESRMSSKIMCNHLIETIDMTLMEFKPKDRFSLVRLENKNEHTNVDNHIGIVTLEQHMRRRSENGFN